MARRQLPAKLLPRRHARAVERERLFERLDAAADRALIWVQGPAGAGKTTLVSTWIARSSCAALWYRADGSDADLPTVFSFLAQGAAALTRRRQLRLPSLMPENLLDVPAFTQRFFRLMWASLPAGSVLVVDGLDQAPGDALAGLLPAALAELLPGQRLIVTSRDAPPAALARASVDGALEVLGWRELQLDAGEALALAGVAGASAASGDAVMRLHRLCGGWAAGFTLGLSHLRIRGDLAAPESAWFDEQLFPYFAGEMLSHADASTQAVLLHSALLPSFRVDQLARLLPSIDAQSVVQGLYRRHFFIDRSELAPPVYRYHDLFREFLLQQGRERLTAEERRRLLRLAADELLQTVQPEDAAPLLQEAKAWDELAQLWCRIAPALLMQGRHATLAHGLLALPPARLDAEPWALYWLGIARLMTGPASSRTCLEAAFAHFRSRDDRIGSVLACSAILQAYLIEYADVTPVDRWADTLEALLFAPGDALPPEVETEGLNATIVLMIRARHPALIDKAVQRARLLQPQSLTPQTRFKLAYFLLQVRNFRGEWREAQRLIAEFGPLPASLELPPLTQMLWHMAASVVLSGAGDFVAGLDAMSRVREVATQNNLLVLEAMIAGNQAMGALNLGDFAEAAACMASARGSHSLSSPIARAQSCLIEGLLAHGRGDLRAAEEHLDAAMRGAEEGGALLFRAPGAVALGAVQLEHGHAEAASRTIADLLAFAQAIGSAMLHHSGLLVQAWIALRSRDEAGALALLREALALGREHGLCIVFPWCPPAMLQELGVLALREGIEPELVCKMLGLRRIAPPAPDADPWPWPLRLRTFGRFEVQAGGRWLQWGAKAPKKPLELLQATLALDAGSGRGALVAALIDELWPSANGDAAQNAFNVALSRLRKLLGDAQAVQQRDSRLHLDRERVWTDVAALQRLAERVDSDETPDAEALADRLLDVYRGPFLADDAAPWAAACRERQRARLRRALSRLIERLEQRQCGDAAGRIRERWAEVDAGVDVADARAPRQRLKAV